MAERLVITDEHVQAAIDLLLRDGTGPGGSTVTYSHVFEAAGLPPPQELHHGGDSHLVTDLMAQLHRECGRRALPPLDALVVHLAGTREGRPGVGYFRINGYQDPFGQRATAEQVIAGHAFWQSQVDECLQWARHSPGTTPG